MYDGTNVEFYLNGMQQPHATNDNGPMVVVPNPLFIGQAGTGKDNEYFEGLIDDVKIYTTALPMSAVRAECGC